MRAPAFFAAIAGPLAAGVPAIYALSCAAPYGHLGDTPAFVARALEHPANPAELLARLCALVPIGPLSLRLSVASAMALAALGAALYRAFDLLLRAQGVMHAGLRGAAGVGLCWFAASSAPLFEESVRPGAGAMTAALVVFALGELQRLWLAPAARSGGRLALALGLLFAQDAGTFLLVLPAVLAGAIGLPIQVNRRLVVQAAAALGGAALLQFHGWAAPAAPGSTLALAPGLAVVRALLDTRALSSVAALLGALALTQTQRVPGLRRSGLAWSLAWLAMVAFGSGGASQSAGALPFALCSVVPISAVLIAALGGALAAPDGSHVDAASVRQLAVGALACAVGAFQLHTAAVRGDASSFALPEAWAASALDLAPARALVLAHDLERGGLARAAAVEARTRPDLRVVSIGELARPSYARTLAESPSLRPLVRSYLLQGALTRAELESLSADRPVLLDEPTTPELHAALRPERLWYEVAGARVARSERTAAEGDYDRALEALARDSGGAERPAARTFLERLDVVASQYFTSRGDGLTRP